MEKSFVMTTYTVFAAIPYEGDHVVFSGTLEEVTEFIKNKNRGYPLEDLEIYSNDAPDVFALYNS